jgi:hypothetical protein
MSYIKEIFMIMQYTSLPIVHRHIRHAWCRYVFPAVLNRDAVTLLAALVVADTSLDEVLCAEGCPGETVGERLHNANVSFSDYEGLLRAHQIRNHAVHHLDFRLCWRAGCTALAAYTRAILDHGVDLRSLEAESFPLQIP